MEGKTNAKNDKVEVDIELEDKPADEDGAGDEDEAGTEDGDEHWNGDGIECEDKRTPLLHSAALFPTTAFHKLRHEVQTPLQTGLPDFH